MRPKKPRKDFPLFAHQNGQWAKKVLGKLNYFGPHSDRDDRSAQRTRALADAAERLWDLQKVDLRAGRKPRDQRVIAGTLTIKDLCNEFMASQELRTKTGELSQRQFGDYLRRHVGCGHVWPITSRRRPSPSGFSQLKVGVGRYVQSANRHAAGDEQLSGSVQLGDAKRDVERIIHFGDDFKLPTTTQLRKHKQKREHGTREFSPVQCQQLLDSATPALKAMITLGLNCGLGNTDIRMLRFSDIDFENGWLDYPRNKTGADRIR